MAERELIQGYQSLGKEALILATEMNAVLMMLRAEPRDKEDPVKNLIEISQGRVSSVVNIGQPRSVRETAREIKAASGGHQELINADFEEVVRWAQGKKPPLGADAIREKLVKRKALLEAILPPAMEPLMTEAMTHVERRHLNRRYANTETMLGDRVEDIPRENFFASEDNYAWDMEELAQALEANSGVMRNPLSREMFSESDIRRILAHRLGRRLRPLQEDQSKYKKGIRPATIDRVAALGTALLADQTEDMAPSRQAMDEFLAFVATLPEFEQETINSLKIEARDSFSRQPFDYTIGQAVRMPRQM
jgi:ribosome-binding protein aMBF1 (putative translation factor)